MGTYTFIQKDGKYWYRLFLTQWGILFGFNVDILPKDNNTESSVEVVPGLWFLSTDRQIRYEINYIEKGLKMIAQKLIDKSPNKANTLLVFRDFEIADCDYMPEGLTDAVLKWAEYALKVDIPKTEIKFNKVLNKYEFYYS